MAFGASLRLEVTLGSPCWAVSGGWMAYQALLYAPREAAWQPPPSLHRSVGSGAIRMHKCKCHRQSPVLSCGHHLQVSLHLPAPSNLCSAASHHRLLFSHTPGVREAKTPSQKIRAEAWLSSRAGVNLFWRYRNYM